MKRLLIATLLCATVGLDGVRALAAGMWSDRAGGAPLQVVALCQTRTSHWEGGSIYSDAEVSVLQVVRGALDLTLTIRQRGGEIDGIGQKVSHVSLLVPGQRYLLFLTKDASGSWLPTSKGVNPIAALSDSTDGVAGEPLDRVIAELGGGD